VFQYILEGSNFHNLQNIRVLKFRYGESRYPVTESSQKNSWVLCRLHSLCLFQACILIYETKGLSIFKTAKLWVNCGIFIIFSRIKSDFSSDFVV